MKFQLTQVHIDNGEPRSMHKCPLALAISEVLGFPVQITAESLVIGDYDFPLPQEALEFIDDFDNEKKTKPFEFELDCSNTRCKAVPIPGAMRKTK